MVTRAADVTNPGSVGSVDRDAETARSGASGERVLYVVSMFPCWSETFIVREIHALLRRGADVRIVSLRRSRETLIQTDAAELMDRVMYQKRWYRSFTEVLRRLVASPCETLRHPAMIVTRLWRTPAAMVKSLVSWYRGMGLMSDIEAFKPDHVHAHWATYASTSALTIADHLDVPFSFTAHAHDIYLEDHLMSEKLRRAAFVATISRFNREFLWRHYPEARRARIEIVRCGVPWHEDPDAVASTTGNRILSVGRFDEIKGFPVLLQACRQLHDEGIDFTCEIIGDGPLRRQVEQYIRRHRLENHVKLLGAQPTQVVARKLEKANLFVLACQVGRNGNMDGIPVALMEAMASGTPVVSTRVSGIPELVEHERTGLLVPPRDPHALAGAMRSLLEDEGLRQRCVRGAVRKVRNEFDADTEGARLLGSIRSITGELHAQKVADSH